MRTRSAHQATLATLMNRYPLESNQSRLPLEVFGRGQNSTGGSRSKLHIPDDRIAVRFLLQG